MYVNVVNLLSLEHVHSSGMQLQQRWASCTINLKQPIPSQLGQAMICCRHCCRQMNMDGDRWSNQPQPRSAECALTNCSAVFASLILVFKFRVPLLFPKEEGARNLSLPKVPHLGPKQGALSLSCRPVMVVWSHVRFRPSDVWISAFFRPCAGSDAFR